MGKFFAIKTMRPTIRIATSLDRFRNACRSFSNVVTASSSSQNSGGSVTADDGPTTKPPKPTKIVLYQYNICPFCHRVRSVLDYAKLPYVATEVNPLTKTEIRQYKDRHRQVPIAEIDGSPVFGSDQIIQQALLRLAPPEKDKNDTDGIFPATCDESSDPWVDFAVKKLAVLLYPNMCRTVGDSFRAFAYVHQTKSFGLGQRMLIQSIGSLVTFMCISMFSFFTMRQALTLFFSSLLHPRPCILPPPG
jgi:glutaredoxin